MYNQAYTGAEILSYFPTQHVAKFSRNMWSKYKFCQASQYRACYTPINQDCFNCTYFWFSSIQFLIQLQKKKRKMRNNFKIYRNCDKKISINRLSLVVMLQLFQETSSTPYTQVHPKLLHNKKIYRKANKKESKQIVANMSWMSRSCQNKKSINQKTNTKTNTRTNKSSTKRMRN